MTKNLEEKFIFHCNSKNLEINQYQLKVIKKLQNFYKKNFKLSFLNFISKQSLKKGFYLYGGVGVGKTMILNFFSIRLMKKNKDYILMNLC